MIRGLLLPRHFAIYSKMKAKTTIRDHEAVSISLLAVVGGHGRVLGSADGVAARYSDGDDRPIGGERP
jgi:hypothetical protein